MYCPQCGEKNSDSARFCTKCGMDLGEYREQWQQDPRGAAGGQAGYPPAHWQPGPQAPPYQPQQYYQYRPAPAYGMVPNIPSYMGWAIATLILCFWPTGIVAVVYASQVGNKLAAGDIAGAQQASHRAKMWCWISFAIGVAWVVIVTIAAVVGALATTTTIY